MFNSLLCTVFGSAASPQERLEKRLELLNRDLEKWAAGLEEKLAPHSNSEVCFRSWPKLRESWVKLIPEWPTWIDNQGNAKYFLDKIDLERFAPIISLPGYRRLKEAVSSAGLVLQVRSIECYGSWGREYLMETTIKTSDGTSFKNYFERRQKAQENNPAAAPETKSTPFLKL
jgi:hypothetical protein